MRNAASQHLAQVGVSALAGGIILVQVLSGDPAATPVGASDGSGSGSADLGGGVASFAIAGDTHNPISPGVMVPINLRFTNPHGFALIANHLKVTVRAVDAPRADSTFPCGLDDFDVAQASRYLPLSLAAHETTSLRRLDLSRSQWPRVGMLNTSENQDGCKHASLTLSFAASGRPST